MGQIRIRGSKEFIEITKEALNLIKEKDPIDFKVLVKNIKLIE